MTEKHGCACQRSTADSVTDSIFASAVTVPVCGGMSVPSAQRPLLGMAEGLLGEEVVLEVELESHALGFPRGVANEELGDSRWRLPT